jgi:hypothetical protein
MGVFVPYHTVERQVDYLKAKQVIEGFGATESGLNRDLFIEKCMSDPWVLNRLEQT